jgi:hypothetical protein
MLVGRMAAVILASAAAFVSNGVRANPIGGQASQACYMHYLGSIDADALYQVPIPEREHVLDCIELYAKTGHLPNDSTVARLSKQYDAADEADSRAYEKELTRRLGRKPTTADYTADLAQSICTHSAGAGKGCAQAVTGAAFATEYAQRIRDAVQEAHEGLLNIMKDPNSAEFDSDDGAGYSFESDGSLYSVCGAINAKNSVGAYTGKQVWVYVVPENIVYTQETGATKAMVLRDCTGRVHSTK